MLRRTASVVLALAAVTGAGTAAAATPHAKAASLLRACFEAVRVIPIIAITPNTPAVPRANQRASRALRICSIAPAIDDLAFKHPGDKALQNAYGAAIDLSLGIGDYSQYLVDLAFGRRNQSELKRAAREVAAGRRLAPTVLKELG
jgi:hypothetical protein